MPKTSRVKELEAQLKVKNEALSEARKGLLKISNLRVLQFQASPGGPVRLEKAFARAQEVAEKTITNISDIEFEAEIANA